MIGRNTVGLRLTTRLATYAACAFAACMMLVLAALGHLRQRKASGEFQAG
jgi:hypothetical protein